MTLTRATPDAGREAPSGWRGRVWLEPATLGWLAVTFPLLAFPEILWPGGRLVVAAIATLSAAAAIVLLARWKTFDLLVAALACLTFIAWLRVGAEKTALTHFSGVALGLLVMAAVATWCRTPSRVALAAAVFLAAGCAALALGLAGTSTAPFKLINLHPSSLPEVKLGLPGLPENGWVNPNALGGLALMVVPLAFAVAAAPGSHRFARGLRALAVATALVGVAAIIIGQARTVWLASWLTAAIAVVWAVRDRRRRVAGLVALVAAPVLFLAAIRGGGEVGADRLLSDAAFALAFRSEHVWSQGLERLGASPWFGIGLNHFRHVYRSPDWVREGIRTSAHAHNIWLQTALDLGVFGLLVYAGLLAALARMAVTLARNRHGLARATLVGAALGILGVHMFGMADAVSLGARIGLFQWIAAGFILAVARPAVAEPAAAARQMRLT